MTAGHRRAAPAWLRASTVAVAVVALAAATACEPGDPLPNPDEGSPDATTTAEPGVPAFRFRVDTRSVERTSGSPLKRRDRRAVQEVLDTVRRLVTDLYVEGFLDPASWRTGTYDGVFALFAGEARAEARQRIRALTVGEDAGSRFTAIKPKGGRLWLRVLVDRSGAANVVSSVVRFQARAVGERPTLFRSDASYLFRRTQRGWRIVSFDVERRDAGTGGG